MDYEESVKGRWAVSQGIDILIVTLQQEVMGFHGTHWLQGADQAVDWYGVAVLRYYRLTLWFEDRVVGDLCESQRCTGS